LDGFVVAGLGRADEVVVGDVERVPGVTKVLGSFVHELLGRDPTGLRRALHLQPVLVGAGQVEDVVTPEPPPPGEHVPGHRRVRVADVRDIVDVIDGGGDVEAAHVVSILPIWPEDSTPWEILTI
jgi:hypothetical protein